MVRPLVLQRRRAREALGPRGDQTRRSRYQGLWCSAGNHQQDARHQRNDEQHEGLTGPAPVRRRRREPGAIDRDSDEQQPDQRGRAPDNRCAVAAPSLDVEGHRSVHSDMNCRSTGSPANSSPHSSASDDLVGRLIAPCGNCINQQRTGGDTAAPIRPKGEARERRGLASPVAWTQEPEALGLSEPVGARFPEPACLRRRLPGLWRAW